MLRRSIQIPALDQINSVSTKQQNYSPSTQDSASPRNDPPSNYYKSSIRKDKQKSQLCKKFLQFGFCPYEKKCKFAHGSHQLRKNQQPNSKYKTKECGVFLTDGHCMYGQRCNFIHKKADCKNQPGLFDAGFQEVKAEVRLQSRLLKMLTIE